MATLDLAIGHPTVGLADRARGISILWAGAVVVAVLYGSLLPFAFDSALLTAGNGFGLLRIGLCRISLEDLFANIIVYLPVGLAVALAVLPSRSAWGRVAIGTAVGGAVSVLAESLQSAMPMRVACWSDVALNMSGALIGAVAAQRLASLVRESLQRCAGGRIRRPMGVLFGALAVGLFIHHLAPFDFITSTSELHESFRQAKWGVLSPRAVDPAAPFALIYSKVVATAWFIALGYLIARSRRESGTPPVDSVATAFLEGGCFVAVVELSQLFVRSSAFDIANIPLRIAAVVMGAWVAVFLSIRTSQRGGMLGESHPLRHSRAVSHSRVVSQSRAVLSPVSRATAVPLMVVWVIGHAMAIMVEPLVRPSVTASSQTTWPFEALWRAPMLEAGWEIGSTMTLHALSAVLILMILRRGRVLFAGPVTAVMIACIGLDAALLASPTGVRGVDLTSAILAAVAAMLVVSIAPQSQPATRSSKPIHPAASPIPAK